MKPPFKQTYIENLIIIDPIVFSDPRGYLFETFHERDYKQICSNFNIAQTYQSRSLKNVLRGLHYQKETAKIVRCSQGAIFDVAVDIRVNSPQFGMWYGLELSDKNNLQLYIPEGFAHGFYVLSNMADVHYHQNKVYSPKEEGCIIWNDKSIDVDWPAADPLISDKDMQGIRLEEYK